MFSDLYNLFYFITIGAWVICYQHIAGTYKNGTGMGIGLSDTLTIVLSYMILSIEILISTVIYLAW